MCQSARVVSLLTAYARDHGEAWTYVAPLVELMRFIAADRNDMVDEAAGAAPSERVLDELARLGAMLQSALRVQTYRDRHNQLCDANDAVVAAAAFVRSLDPVVTSAKTLTSSADDTLAAGRRGSLVNDTCVHHGAGGVDHFEGNERAVADGHRRASPGDRGAGAGGTEDVPASLEPTRPDEYPWHITMCDCDWQIAEAIENQCKYHREMQAKGQEHYPWCPVVGGGGFVGSDCSSDATRDGVSAADAERPAAEEQPSDSESENADRADRPPIVEYMAERADGHVLRETTSVHHGAGGDDERAVANAERPAAEEAAHGGARSKLENAQQLQKLRFCVWAGTSANDNDQPPWRVAVTMQAGGRGGAELVFTAVASTIKGARNEACRAAWDAFKHWGRDDASVTKASTCVETYHRALSPTIVHREPSGSEYVERTVHGYINIECRPVETIDAFIWRFIGNLRGVYLHCDIIGRTRPQCGDVFKHFKAAVRRYDGNQFDEEFQSYCNLSTALELAGLFSDMCSRSDDRSAAYGEARSYGFAYGEARSYGFVPRNQEQCTCASCVSVCCDQCYN